MVDAAHPALTTRQFVSASGFKIQIFRDLSNRFPCLMILIKFGSCLAHNYHNVSSRLYAICVLSFQYLYFSPTDRRTIALMTV